MTLKQIYNSPQNVRNTTTTIANNMGKISNPKCISEHSSQQTWGTQPVLGNEITKKTCTDHAGGEITVSQPVGEREQQCRTQNRPVSTGYGHTIHQSAEENCCVGRSSKILCVKTKTGRSPSA